MKNVTDAVRQFNGVWPFKSETMFYDTIDGWIGGGTHVESRVTLEEFEEVSARLSGKPGWVAAPEGFNWRWQNADGGWWFGKGLKPQINEEHGYWWTRTHSVQHFPGTVLGDWRETLERRPEAKNDWSRILNPQSLSDYHHSIELEIPPFSELNQQGPMDWLPPIGFECEVSRGGSSFFEKCVPKYHGINSSVIEFKSHDGSKREAWVQREHTVFRQSEYHSHQLAIFAQCIQAMVKQSPTTASEIAEIWRMQQEALGLLNSKYQEILDSLAQRE